MGSERLLRDLPSPEVVAERSRVTGMLMCVVDDVIRQHATVNHAVAEALLAGFGAELARLRKFVREGGSVEEFRAARGATGPAEPTGGGTW